jgi:hypothetical protein
MMDHLVDHLDELSIEADRIVSMNTGDEVRALTDIRVVFFAPFDPFMVLVALSHLVTCSIAAFTCFS